MIAPGRSFDGFYLFNPFYENTFRESSIDDTVTRSGTKYNLYVETVVKKLRMAKAGARVVTYHGFGGAIPESYKLNEVIAAGSDYLELWIKGI